MKRIYNPPPNWPPPPANWQPGPGWQPDPRWGPPPPGWKVWAPPNGWGRAFKRSFAAAGLVGAPLYVLAYQAGFVTEAVMGGFVLAALCVAVLARISPFRWPFMLYVPAVLVVSLFTYEYYLIQMSSR